MVPPLSGVHKAAIAPPTSTVLSHGSSGVGLVSLANLRSTSSHGITDSTIHVACSTSSMSVQYSGQAEIHVQRTHIYKPGLYG